MKEQNWKNYLASDEEEPADADLFTDEESEREDEKSGESEEK